MPVSAISGQFQSVWPITAVPAEFAIAKTAYFRPDWGYPNGRRLGNPNVVPREFHYLSGRNGCIKHVWLTFLTFWCPLLATARYTYKPSPPTLIMEQAYLSNFMLHLSDPIPNHVMQ